MSKLPGRVGDDKHPLEPPQMPFLDSDRPSSKQRGRVFLKILEKTQTTTPFQKNTFTQ